MRSFSLSRSTTAEFADSRDLVLMAHLVGPGSKSSKSGSCPTWSNAADWAGSIIQNKERVASHP